MKILHCTHSVNPSGGGVIEAIKQMAAVHQRDGHHIQIASLDAPDAPWVADCPVPVRALGPGCTSYGYARHFVPWLREHRVNYDVVIVNGIWQYTSLGVWRAVAGSSTPYLVYPHGMLDPWFRRAYPAKHLKKVAYWRLAEGRVFREARAVVFTSEEEQRCAQQAFQPYDCHEVVANLGTAATGGEPTQQREYFYARFPELRGKRLLLFLGRLHEKKGCDLLIRALARVRAESRPTGDDGMHLVMAGPCADAGYLKQLKTLASFCFPGGPPPITWTGMLTGDLKWGAFRAAEAFVLPSHQENFGFSIAEALACGLPVLMSDKVNIWREIEKDRAGLIENDDFEGTVRLLHGWEAMALEFRQSMRTSALRCFLSRFEIELAAGNFIDLIENLIHPPEEPIWDLRPGETAVDTMRGAIESRPRNPQP